MSYVISQNTKGEHPCFSYTPLNDSLNHEDVEKHPKFSGCGCRDLCTSSFDHDVDSLIVNISKPLVFYDRSIDEVETPQAIEALQLELMAMSGPCCPQVSSTSDQKTCEAPKAPHHSFVCTKDQSNTQISFPPLESHDPITYALEESYTTSTLSNHIFSLFLIFSYLS